MRSQPTAGTSIIGSGRGSPPISIARTKTSRKRRTALTTGRIPVVSAVRRFRDDFVRAIEEGGDPRPEPMMEVPAVG